MAVALGRPLSEGWAVTNSTRGLRGCMCFRHVFTVPPPSSEPVVSPPSSLDRLASGLRPRMHHESRNPQRLHRKVVGSKMG